MSYLVKYPVGKTYEYHLHRVRYKVKLNDDVRDIEFTTLIFWEARIGFRGVYYNMHKINIQLFT